MWLQNRSIPLKLHFFAALKTLVWTSFFLDQETEVFIRLALKYFVFQIPLFKKNRAPNGA